MLQCGKKKFDFRFQSDMQHAKGQRKPEEGASGTTTKAADSDKKFESKRSSTSVVWNYATDYATVAPS